MMVGSSLYLRPLMVFTRLVMVCSQFWYLQSQCAVTEFVADRISGCVRAPQQAAIMS